jgi:mannitol/fructose-specific phosphotransferase system IIA component
MIANITQENLHLGYKAKNKAEVLTLLGEEFKRKATSAKTAPLFLMKGNVRCPPF